MTSWTGASRERLRPGASAIHAVVVLLMTVALLFSPGAAFAQHTDAAAARDGASAQDAGASSAFTSRPLSVEPAPYDLARIVERALTHHLAVRVAELQHAAAQAQAIQQRAALKPSLSVDVRPHWFETPVPDLDALDADNLPELPADFDWADCVDDGQCAGLGEYVADLVGQFSDGIPQRLQHGRGHSVTFTGNISLWRSPLQRALADVADLQLHHADEDVQTAAANAIMQSMGAYFDVLRADKALHIAQWTLQEADVRAAEISSKVEEGTATRIDLLQVEAERHGARAQVVQARGEVTATRMILNSVLGFDLNVPLHLAPLTVDAVAGDRAGVGTSAGAGSRDPLPDIEAALQLAAERGDVRRARTDWQLAGAGATIAREQAKPGLQLFGTSKWPDVELNVGIDRHGYLGGSVTHSETYLGADRVEGDPASWAAGIEVSWPLLDGGKRRAEQEAATLQAEQAKLYYEHMRLTSQTEVLTAYARLQAAEQALIGAAQGVEAGAEALHVARTLAAAGAATEAAVIRSEVALARAEQGWLDAVYGATMARAAYLQAAGVLVHYWQGVL